MRFTHTHTRTQTFISARAAAAAAAAGVDERLSDGVCRCCRLLPSQRRDCVSRKRGECAPLDETSRSDHAEKRSWHQGPLRDPLRTRIHFQLYAGASYFLHLQLRRLF